MEEKIFSIILFRLLIDSARTFNYFYHHFDYISSGVTFSICRLTPKKKDQIINKTHPLNKNFQKYLRQS